MLCTLAGMNADYSSMDIWITNIWARNREFCGNETIEIVGFILEILLYLFNIKRRHYALRTHFNEVYVMHMYGNLYLDNIFYSMTVKSRPILVILIYLSFAMLQFCNQDSLF